MFVIWILKTKLGKSFTDKYKIKSVVYVQNVLSLY